MYSKCYLCQNNSIIQNISNHKTRSETLLKSVCRSFKSKFSNNYETSSSSKVKRIQQKSGRPRNERLQLCARRQGKANKISWKTVCLSKNSQSLNLKIKSKWKTNFARLKKNSKKKNGYSPTKNNNSELIRKGMKNKLFNLLTQIRKQANASILDLKDQLTKHELRVESQEELIKQLKSKITNKESEFLIEKQNSNREYEELENKFKQKIKELDDIRSKKEIEDMLVVKLKVNTEELKTKEATIEQLRQEKELLQKKVQVISETVDIKQANEENLKQEVEHFKEQFSNLIKTSSEEKKSLMKKINTEETKQTIIETKDSEIKQLKESNSK